MPISVSKYDLRLSDSRWDRLAFRVEHWLLSPGSSDMAQLRGYLRVKAWRDRTSARDRLWALKATLKRPARTLRESWQAARQYGADARRDVGVSFGRQVAQLWWAYTRHGVRPEVYYTFRLYEPGQLRRSPAFFQGDEDDQLFRLLNLHTARDEAELLLDKARFERWLAAHDLPTVRTLLEFEEGRVTTSQLGPDGLPLRNLFSKPNDALQGRGTERWAFDGIGWVGEDGRRRTEPELMSEFAELSRSGGLLVQEQLQNHPALAPLAPGALSTVRILTLRGLDGRVRVVVAVCKLPTGDAPTDHMRLGGVAAPVDVVTGRLGRAVGKGKPFLSPVDHHPKTGATIPGFQLPLWEEATALAVRAHDALERLVCVGWDVAILEHGPVIIEGNDNPGHTSSQTPTGIPLGETEVVPTVAARLRQAFATPRAGQRAVARTPADPVKA